MKLTHLPDVEPRPRRVAIGTFDGVHLGHREVIAGAETVITFDPHPQSVVAPGTQPKLLTTLDRKAELIASLGVEELVVIPFDGDFAARSAAGLRRPRPRRARRGDACQRRRELPLWPQGPGRRRRCSPATPASRPAWCRCWRSMARSSAPATSAACLPAARCSTPMSCSARRSPSTARSSARRQARPQLGFPTANLVPDAGFVVPGHGVYACRVRLPDGTAVAAATNVGVRPQFVTGRGELIEAFLIDWSRRPLRREAPLEFLARLRGERRFESRRRARRADGPRRRRGTRPAAG